MGQLIRLIISDKISGKIAKDVFEEMFKEGKSPEKIVIEKGLTQVTDTVEIEKIINKIVENNEDKVLQYKAGKNKLLGFFVGMAMKESKGKANPKILNKILLEKLK